MSSIAGGAFSVSGNDLNAILCEFVADRRCACVCKRWYETMQKHFSLVASNHLLSGTLIKPFMARALIPRLTLEGLQNQGRAAILENTASLVLKILRIDCKPVTIDQIMCLRTPNIERLIQSNKDKNLVSFYNVLKQNIEDVTDRVGPDFTEAGEIRDWMRGNPVLLAENRLFLSQFRTLDGFDQIITEIPEEIHFLAGLMSLNLAHTQVAALPDGLNFSALTDLDVSHTRIAALPDGLNFSALRHLDLSHTRIAALPDRLNAPELRSLNLSWTKIVAWPNRLNAPKLESMDLRCTQLASLPARLNFPTLRYLDLRDAQIITLPGRYNAFRVVTLDLTPTQLATWPGRPFACELIVRFLINALIEFFSRLISRIL